MTLFPEMCERVLDESIIGRARRQEIITVECHNIRDYTGDKHRHVDDMPYGGGQGMLMKPEPLEACFSAVSKACGMRPFLIYMSPKGKVFHQNIARELLQKENICILCGHYEGVDQRFIDSTVDMFPRTANVETVAMFTRLQYESNYARYFYNRAVSDVMEEYGEWHDEWKPGE